MVLDLRVVGKLAGAVLEEVEGPLVRAAPVQDPAERVRDPRIVRS
jgi:hypothetical protein